MTESGLTVELTLPFAWREGRPTPAEAHGSLLLLRVVNTLDGGEPEPDRARERLEARLDLMLHWLGMQLFGQAGPPAGTAVRLTAERVAWPAETAPAAELTLSLYLHAGIAAPLLLPARLLAYREGWAEAALDLATPELADAWNQWLFRRHRRAVHEARHRTEPS